MLNKPDATPVFEDGKAVGVTSEGQTAKAKLVVGDPSYFPERVQRGEKVVRAICILSHPIPNTAESHSVQIILPQRQVGVFLELSLKLPTTGTNANLSFESLHCLLWQYLQAQTK